MKSETLFEATIPVFIRFLHNLDAILSAGERYVAEGKISEQALLDGKLAPDMYNTIQQVGYAYFMALETVTNMTGKAAPEFGYDEKSIGQLHESLGRVTTFLRTIKPEDFADADGKEVKTYLSEDKTFPPDIYVRELAVPNFFFHVTTAYDILRHLGVPLTKQDYLGSR